MAHSFGFPRERVGKALHKAGLSEMPYGYLLRPPATRGPRGRAYELAMAGTGIGVALLVVWLILLPALRTMDDTAVLRVATSITLLSLALILLRNANRGNLFDSEIDFEAEEVRIVRRNARGMARVGLRIPFDQISSVFVHRSKTRASSANALCLRVSGSDAEIRLAQGSDEAMSTLHRRLVRDINNVVLARRAERLAASDRALEMAEAVRAASAGLDAA